MAINILFVCTGNTCRSSMAEGIALHFITEARDKYQDLWVASAGTYAFEGLPAADEAVLVSSEAGIDLKEHRTRALTPELIRAANLILTMTQGHKEHILNLDPNAAGKVFLLKEFTGNSEGINDIKDPFGQAAEVYRESFHELYTEIKKALEKIADGSLN